MVCATCSRAALYFGSVEGWSGTEFVPPLPCSAFMEIPGTEFVGNPAGGVTLSTNLSINPEIRSWPSFLRMLVETLRATANIGIIASMLEYASAEARTGQRLRTRACWQ